MPAIATHVTTAWSVRPSVQLSHLCTLPAKAERGTGTEGSGGQMTPKI